MSLKKTKKTEPVEEFVADFDLMDCVPVPAIPSVGIDAMDFALFADGIEDITEESEQYVNALIYGPNGSGKTTVSGTFPGPVLVLDFNEKGTRSLVGTGANKRLVSTFDLFQMSYWYLKNGKHPYKTVVLDTITNLQEVTMRSILGEDATRMPYKNDYGDNVSILKRWLMDFRNLPMNVVFVCQEKRDSDEDTDLDSDKQTVYPQTYPSMRGILGGAVDIIGNTYIEEVDDENGNMKVRYCMRVGANAKYMAKCRTPIGKKCPRAIVNPTFKTLNKIMSGQWGIKTKIKKEE